MIQSSVAYGLVIIFISVVYILRERGQIIYLFIYLFTCVLEGNKKKTKGVERKEKEEKENKRSEKRTKGVERIYG